MMCTVQCGWERGREQNVAAESGYSVWTDRATSRREGLGGADDGGTVFLRNTWRHDADLHTDDIPQPPQEGRTVLN